MNLEQAADEFDRRAMSPQYGAVGTATFERTRIMACAQWLRDMAQDEQAKSSGPECSAVFRYEAGHVWFETPTVAELIAYLSRFSPDMPVIATWENTTHGLSCAGIDECNGRQVLEFDVDTDHV